MEYGVISIDRTIISLHRVFVRKHLHWNVKCFHLVLLHIINLHILN
jgi:hypothetical protein